MYALRASTYIPIPASSIFSTGSDSHGEIERTNQSNRG
jgi:hypothetical protein